MRIPGDGHNHFAEYTRGALDQINMPVGDRIKTPWVNGRLFEFPLPTT